jgi:hypothetical protein
VTTQRAIATLLCSLLAARSRLHRMLRRPHVGARHPRATVLRHDPCAPGEWHEAGIDGWARRVLRHRVPAAPPGAAPMPRKDPVAEEPAPRYRSPPAASPAAPQRSPVP